MGIGVGLGEGVGGGGCAVIGLKDLEYVLASLGNCQAELSGCRHAIVIMMRIMQSPLQFSFDPYFLISIQRKQVFGVMIAKKHDSFFVLIDSNARCFNLIIFAYISSLLIAFLHGLLVRNRLLFALQWLGVFRVWGGEGRNLGPTHWRFGVWIFYDIWEILLGLDFGLVRLFYWVGWFIYY
jgi:hypothetical protein